MKISDATCNQPDEAHRMSRGFGKTGIHSVGWTYTT